MLSGEPFYKLCYAINFPGCLEEVRLDHSTQLFEYIGGHYLPMFCSELHTCDHKWLWSLGLSCFPMSHFLWLRDHSGKGHREVSPSTYTLIVTHIYTLVCFHAQEHMCVFWPMHTIYMHAVHMHITCVNVFHACAIDRHHTPDSSITHMLAGPPICMKGE